MEEKAARAYDLAALKYWGPSTHINFPVDPAIDLLPAGFASRMGLMRRLLIDLLMDIY
jgi:hypothetical protein